MRDLICIPTEFERTRLEPHLTIDHDNCVLETVGFGVIQSGIGATLAIVRHRPKRVLLAGIAGRFPERTTANLGQAISFKRVVVDGLGVGQGTGFRDAWSLGWHWAGDEGLPLFSHDPDSDELLSVCSASNDSGEAAWRAERFPTAGAEDMEGYAVALACQKAGVPLTVVRGLSNEVGERDKSLWRTDEALRSAAVLLQTLLDFDS